MADTWDLIIKPRGKWLDFKLRELISYRDLVMLFVRRDFVAQYKQTILGPAWHIIQPLLTTIMFTVVFGNIASLPTDGLPKFIFYMAGNVMWGYFAQCLTKTADTFITNAAIFGKVYFPRLAVPVSIVISSIISFGIQFLFFLCFLVYFLLAGSSIHLNPWVFFTPVLLLMMGSLGLGLGIIISSMTTRYRDLKHLVAFGVQLLMYATPVIYPLTAVPEKYRIFLLANPMTPIIEMFRYAFLGAGNVHASHLLLSGATILLLLLIGIGMFNRVERTFMDTV